MTIATSLAGQITSFGDDAPACGGITVGMTDGMLVRSALDGDARAFTALVDRHAAACLRFATRMLGERADAEDVAQETFLRVFHALHAYDEQTAFRTWLFSILVNRCRTALLRRARRERRVVLDDDAVRHTEAARGADAADLQDEIQWAMARLPAEQREAFLLRHVEELTYDEMADATGLGTSALKMRVKRACLRLQHLLGEEGRSDANR
jgi:RNA polymerase sigma-70 factor, ECF subfamily